MEYRMQRVTNFVVTVREITERLEADGFTKDFLYTRYNGLSRALAFGVERELTENSLQDLRSKGYEIESVGDKNA